MIYTRQANTGSDSIMQGYYRPGLKLRNMETLGNCRKLSEKLEKVRKQKLLKLGKPRKPTKNYKNAFNVVVVIADIKNI